MNSFGHKGSSSSTYNVSTPFPNSIGLGQPLIPLPFEHYVPWQIAGDAGVISAKGELEALEALKAKLLAYKKTITKVISDGDFESTTQIYGNPFVDLHEGVNGDIGSASSSLGTKRDEAVDALATPIAQAQTNFSNAKTTAMAAYTARLKAESEKQKGSKK